MTSEVKMQVVAWIFHGGPDDGPHARIPRVSLTRPTGSWPTRAELVLQSDALAAIEAARVEARAKALEEAACEAESWCGGKLLLAAGELTARELRTCRAVTKAIAARLRSLAKEAP